MDMDKIRELISVFDASGLCRLKLACEEMDLELEKAAAVGVGAVTPLPAVKPPQAVPEAVPQAADAEGVAVTSPIVGVFYAASSPEAAPYAQVGQSVKKGQTLCIIEAMKVMNEVPAPCDGVVGAVHVQDGDLVEYGQLIMVMR